MSNITLDLSTIGLPVGIHSIQMKLSDDGATKRDSALSNAVTYVQYQQLTAPVISLGGDILSWSAVPNASSYKLYADNTDKGTVTSGIDLTTLQLAVGSHSIQVMAVGSGYYTDSDKSNSVSYTVQQTGGYDFANDSWATIASQIKAGTDHYSLGDTKTDTVTIGGNTYTATFKIVDDTVGRYVTQSGTSHKVIEMQELVGDSDGYGIMWHDGSTPNSDNTFLMAAAPSSGPTPPPPTADGTSFADCSLFRYLNNTIIDYLPSDLKAVLETTTVYSGDGDQTASASTNVAATGKIFLPCATELYGDELYGSSNYGFANSSEGTPQFTYYSSIGVTTDNYDALTKYMIEDTSSTYYYWLRSPCVVNRFDSSDCFVSYDGFLRNDYVSVGRRVSLCFAW